MIEQRPITGRVVRVYDPPRALENGARDFDATKVDLAPDGSITLSKIESTGKELDIRSGREMEGFKATLLAIIGPDGKLRAETIDLEAPSLGLGSRLD